MTRVSVRSRRTARLSPDSEEEEKGRTSDNESLMIEKALKLLEVLSFKCAPIYSPSSTPLSIDMRLTVIAGYDRKDLTVTSGVQI